MPIPSWIQGIFLHSIGEIADNFWTQRTAEQKAGDFGKGWGDEHQHQELLAKLDSKNERPIWMDFCRWVYIERTGWATSITAKNKLKELRLFLTSWDQVIEKGTKTSSTEKKVGDVTDKVQLVEKVFKKKTANALAFIKTCVEIIRATEAAELSKLEAEARRIPGATVNEAGRRHCREAGYRELVRYFEAAQLPVMPLPEEPHWTKTIDSWIERQLGADLNPSEAINTAIVRIGSSSARRLERDNRRKQWARSRYYRWPLLPIIIIINQI